MDTNPPTPDRDPTDPNTIPNRARSYPPRSNPSPDPSPFDSAPLRGPHAETDYTAPSEPAFSPAIEPDPFPDPFAERPLPAAEEPFLASTPPASPDPFGTEPAFERDLPPPTTPPVTLDSTVTSQATIPPTAPPPPNNRIRNCLLIALGVLLLGICGVCVAVPLGLTALGPQIGEVFATVEAELPTPESSDSGDAPVDGETISVFDVSLGDCFNDDTDTSDLVEELETVSCDGPHDNEVFAIFDYPADAGEVWPGEEDLDAYTEEECLAAFESYVGTPYDESELYYFPIQPTEETWEQGDREIVCALYGVDDNQDPIEIEGSMQGSNR